MKRPRLFVSASMTVLAVVCQPQLVQGSSCSTSSSSSSMARDLQEWIRARCGNNNDNNNNNKAAIWVYQGALLDPMDGRRLALVEGLELVQCVGQIHGNNNHDQHQNSKADYQRRCGDLQVAPLLTSANATVEYAATLWSRKLFCYYPETPTSSPENHTTPQLLRHFRIRPNAPVRTIPTQQAVALYDTATTFVAANGNDHDLIVHSEWPDRQSIWARATRALPPPPTHELSTTTTNKDASKAFAFTVYARQKSFKQKRTELFDLSTTTSSSTSTNNNHTYSHHPPRSKWIEFGLSSSQGKHKFGARESYRYRMTIEPPPSQRPSWPWQRPLPTSSSSSSTSQSSSSSCTVQYSRYGEGPPFVGPGRLCSLELTGRRVDSFHDVPPLTRSLLQTRLPRHYWQTMRRMTSRHHHHPLEDATVFRTQFRRPVPALLPSKDDQEEEVWWPDVVKRQTQACWQRVSQSAKSKWGQWRGT